MPATRARGRLTHTVQVVTGAGGGLRDVIAGIGSGIGSVSDAASSFGSTFGGSLFSSL